LALNQIRDGGSEVESSTAQQSHLYFCGNTTITAMPVRRWNCHWAYEFVELACLTKARGHMAHSNRMENLFRAEVALIMLLVESKQLET
jgi:hypothetical protein